MERYILALDQGTTSSRALLVTHRGRVAGQSQQEFPQIYPAPGHVEHDPEAIWKSQLETARAAIQQVPGGVDAIAAIGVTNQRETTILWDRTTGKPIAPAIVWQSRITSPACERLKQAGYEPLIREKTGLVLDAYFSATKIAHLLDTIPGARQKAERGDVLFGTVDSFLIWRLTGGRQHVTDVSNASRTLLLNISTLSWDDELLRVFGVPRAMLPEVVSSSGMMGETDPSLLGRAIPISGCAGDQQAATFGQACFTPGDVKNTYGTGCFLLMNTGDRLVRSPSGLITTVGWRIGQQTTYCLEGSVFIAGAVVQWLRDGLGVITTSAEVEALAATVPDSEGVYFVPAFVGLGAPYWDPSARGMLIGLTRGTTKAHIARAAVDSMAYQTLDLLDAMQLDAGIPLAQIKVDGGASRNNSLMQFQADLTGVQVRRPMVQETTALGAAYLAGLGVGFWSDPSEIAANWALDRVFEPGMADEERYRRASTWRRAVDRSRGWML
ncbi:MAG: glycerol kinase [Planctomycetota bacterium]|nr:MAG: glycerol kinase [Planctomycetota bacterium]